jgi:hypothetical protein
MNEGLDLNVPLKSLVTILICVCKSALFMSWIFMFLTYFDYPGYSGHFEGKPAHKSTLLKSILEYSLSLEFFVFVTWPIEFQT